MQEAAPVSDTEAKPGQSTSFPQHLSLLRGTLQNGYYLYPILHG